VSWLAAAARPPIVPEPAASWQAALPYCRAGSGAVVIFAAQHVTGPADPIQNADEFPVWHSRS
jgi:hypothetical protein